MKTRLQSGKKQVHDPARKKWVALTPEERVRQAVVEYLHKQLQVPLSLICVEYSLSHLESGNLKQADIVVWRPGRAGERQQVAPWLLVECKAPSVKISSAIEYQVIGYLAAVPAENLMISNGNDSRYFRLEGSRYTGTEGLPAYGI